MFETIDFLDLQNAASLIESSVDFPMEDLSPEMWDKDPKGEYTLKSEIRQQILDLVSAYPDADLMAMVQGIRIVGSMGTNQYTPDADIDVHLTLKPGVPFDAVLQKEVKDWSLGQDQKVNEHPLEVYIQDNPSQDLMSDGCYDVMTAIWCAGPKVVPADHDPYTDFSHVFDDIRASVGDADKLFGELKRDTLDYKAVSDAMGRMSSEQKEAFRDRLESKLKEIEDDIEALYSEKSGWVAARKDASKPATPEEALEDLEKSRKWKDTNATFKFIARYNYLRVINDLKRLLGDDGITSDEVDQVTDLLKGGM